jgi:hypothetical protein
MRSEDDTCVSANKYCSYFKETPWIGQEQVHKPEFFVFCRMRILGGQLTVGTVRPGLISTLIQSILSNLRRRKFETGTGHKYYTLKLEDR